MTRLPFLIGLAAAGLLPFYAVGQENAGVTQVAAFNMNPLVVTSTLGVETVEESLSSVTVVDSEALEQQDPKGMADILRGQPGINVISNGSFGKNTSVYMRGTGSESTVLLLDGIRIRSATAGSAPWQYIPPQLLDRVEIVRGPKGSLYGADAVGGVVQGFTTPRDDRDRHWVEAGGGSFATQRYGAGASGQVGNTSYSVQGHYLDTDGTNVRRGGEDKGFRNAAGTFSVNHAFDNGASLGMMGLHSGGNTEFNGGETDFNMRTLGVKASTPVTGSWSTSVKLSEARDEQDNDLDIGPSFFDTRSRTAHWENTLAFGDHQLIVGVEHRVDDVDSSTTFTEDSRDNTAVFSQLLTEFGAADLQLSGRWDDNEAFGEETTGAIALGYDLNRTYSVRASYGTAFRAPTFNDLYFPGFGNSELSPETSGTAELGVRGDYDAAFWDLALFRTDVDDLIEFSPAAGQPENIAEARIEGVELGAGFRIADFKLNSAITLQDPTDRATGNRLSRRSTRSARLDADYTPGRYLFGASLVAEGDRYNDSANTDKLAGFGVLNLRAGMDVTRKLSLSLKVENVLDRRYSTARATPFASQDFDYLAAGRAVFASIRYGVK